MKLWRIWTLCLALITASAALAERVDEARIADEVIAPYSLGEPTDIEGVWELLNGSGQPGGYVIESESLAPLPGFGGSPMNMMVVIDLEGNFIDVKLLDQNEPIFVSGLGEAPLRAFLEQYRGHSVNTAMTVGTNYGAGGSGGLVFLDGVTKATASVRIAHESIIGAAREVARQKLKGGAKVQPAAAPNLDYDEPLSWDDLVAQGLAQNFQATHGDVRALFEGTIWQDDDPFADRADDELYVDLWVVDIGPPSVARAVLGERSLADLDRMRAIAPDDEPILLIEAGDHGLVSADFVRNTSPTLITARQDDLPIALRDADLQIDRLTGVPDGMAMVVRADRRLGFDPVREWQIGLLAEREHGMFQPEIGEMELAWSYQSDPRFFDVVEVQEPLSPFASAVRGRLPSLIVLSVMLVIGVAAMAQQRALVRQPWFSHFRVIYLVATLVIIGWWGQGQLSIVTPLAAMHAILSGKSLAFLLYDPFSLLIWAVVVVSFFIWGRALFCGWLCPFGAFQEIIQRGAARLGIKPYTVSEKWDQRLKWGKYLTLGVLVVLVFWRPEDVDKAAEVEPFKTAISVGFQRAWYFVAYAVFWLLLTAFISKGFCRYVCPLGAVMALGGAVQLRPWIKRRAECGSPCQLCRVRCPYQSITPAGAVQYSECLGCLECVDIYENPRVCVPLVLAAKKERGKP